MSDYVKAKPIDVYAVEFTGYGEITPSDVKACIPGLSDQCETIKDPKEAPTPIHPPAVFEGTSVTLPDGSTHVTADCLWKCLFGDETVEAVGAGGAGAVASGSVPKKLIGVRVLPGSSKFTSVPSIIAHKYPHLDVKLPKWMPNKAPMLQLNRFPPGIKIVGTKSALRFLGRWIPGIGWGLLAADLVILDQCVANCRNSKSVLKAVWDDLIWPIKEAR